MGKNPSKFKGAKLTVEQVSWDDAVAFCKALSSKTGQMFRLPTEAEWEYACRAGTTTRFSFGDNDGSLGGYAWYSSNSRRETNPVGRMKPNAFGLYDMHGNVWEWCGDWAGDYSSGSATDPTSQGTQGHCESKMLNLGPLGPTTRNHPKRPRTLWARDHGSKEL